MKRALLVVVLISMVFILSGCEDMTEGDWNKIICSGKADSWIGQQLLGFYCNTKGTSAGRDQAKETPKDRYVKDEKFCRIGGYWDNQEEKCISCGEHAEINQETGKCHCVSGYVRVSGACVKEEEKDLCKDTPHSYPESGGCKCEDGYVPSKTISACILQAEAECDKQGVIGAFYDADAGRCYCKPPMKFTADKKRCLPLLAQEAFDAIEYAKAYLANMKKVRWLGIPKERYPAWELKETLPSGVYALRASRYNAVMEKTMPLVEEAEEKLKLAQLEYDNGQHSIAAQFAQDAKALLEQADTTHLGGACSFDVRPKVINEGKRTVHVDIDFPSYCDCQKFTLSIIKYSYKWKVTFWSSEGTSVLASVPACSVGTDGIVTISEDLLDIDSGGFSGKRGPLFLWRTYNWLVGELIPQ